MPYTPRIAPFGLSDALSLASAALRAGASAFAAADSDPLRLNLPPLVGIGGFATITADTLKRLGAMYLQSELEQAGVVIVAEYFARSRLDLQGVAMNAARKLENFARQASQWYDDAYRQQLFARLFGTGSAASADGGVAVNRPFEQLLASFCASALRVEEGYRWSSRPDPMLDAACRRAAQAVVVNLSGRQIGNALTAAPRIDAQLRLAIDLLEDPEVGAQFGTHGMWNVLRRVLAANTPDLGRLTVRGTSGLGVIHWLADSLAEVQNDSSSRPLIAPGSPVLAHAARWLVATGLTTPAPAGAPVGA